MNTAEHEGWLELLRKLGYSLLVFLPMLLIRGALGVEMLEPGSPGWPYVSIMLFIGFGMLPFAMPHLAHRALKGHRIKAAYAFAAVPSILVLAFFLFQFVQIGLVMMGGDW